MRPEERQLASHAGHQVVPYDSRADVEARTIEPVKRDAAEILKDALALPSEARATLARALLESLATQVDEGAEVAWAAEVDRRLADLDSGSVKAIPWPEVRRRLAVR
jgi:putative addiction module component (TIGR02574 family)